MKFLSNGKITSECRANIEYQFNLEEYQDSVFVWRPDIKYVITGRDVLFDAILSLHISELSPRDVHVSCEYYVDDYFRTGLYRFPDITLFRSIQVGFNCSSSSDSFLEHMLFWYETLGFTIKETHMLCVYGDNKDSLLVL